MKNLEMVSAIQLIRNLDGENAPQFSVQVAHKIVRNQRKLIHEYEPCEDDIKKINKQDLSDEEKLQKINELLKTDVEVILDMITLDDLGDIHLTATQMEALDFMIKD